MDLEDKLSEFKAWMTMNYIKQKDDKRKAQFFDLLMLTNTLELQEANEDIKPLLYKGLIFNGGNIIYYDERAFNLTQKEFNEVVWGHIAQFISGSYLRNNNWFFGMYVLMTVHFGIVNATPKYGQSVRGQLVQKFYSKVDWDFFYVDRNISEFLFNEIANGRVSYPEGFSYSYKTPQNDNDIFITPLGVILQLQRNEVMLTMKDGLHQTYKVETIKAVFIREKHGELRKTSFKDPETKPLAELKEVYDKLLGDE